MTKFGFKQGYPRHTLGWYGDHFSCWFKFSKSLKVIKNGNFQAFDLVPLWLNFHYGENKMQKLLLVTSVLILSSCTTINNKEEILNLLEEQNTLVGYVKKQRNNSELKELLEKDQILKEYEEQLNIALESLENSNEAILETLNDKEKF